MKCFSKFNQSAKDRKDKVVQLDPLVRILTLACGQTNPDRNNNGFEIHF